MKKLKTNDDLIKELLTPEEQAELYASVEKEVEKYWGGKRANSGRKPSTPGKILKFTKRLTEQEVKFINYAREHNINYDDLMEM